MTTDPGPYGATADPGATGRELTDAEQAYLAQQAAQHAAQAPNPAAQQAAVAAQLGAAQRGPELPAESDMDRLMAMFKEQADQLGALRDQLGILQKQEVERSAAAGGPVLVRYAQGIYDHLLAHAAQHPDLGAVVPATPDQAARVTGHFETAHTHAAALLQAAKDAMTGGPLQAVEDAAGKLAHFIERGHKALGGKHVDFGAIAQMIEYVGAEAVRLAA